MRRIALAVLLVAMLAPGHGAAAALTDEACQRARDAQRAFGDELCRRTLDSDDAGNLQFALAGLWLNRRTDEANARLSRAYDQALGDARPT